MLRMIAGRAASGIATLVVASVVIFAATELLPGDVATAALGREATPEALEKLRERLGLGRPAIVRYGDWIGGVVRGDFGSSAVNGVPVTKLIGHRLVNSSVLLLITVALLVPLSLWLGTFAALRQGRKPDTAIQLTTLAAVGSCSRSRTRREWCARASSTRSPRSTSRWRA